ncbi:MAG: ABC transporter substrate-binding protein [Dehalococcoidales bacterium]|nr:ABC transporter substrate-binding protein [Dehalococcoidales bacterium]
MRKLLILSLFLICALIFIGCSEKETTTSAPAAAPATKPAPAASAPAASAPAASAPATSKPAANIKTGGDVTMLWRSVSGAVGWQPEAFGEINSTASLFFEGLFKHMSDMTYQPCLALSYETDTAEKSLTFHLRKGVKYHDGTDFNAETAKWMCDQHITLKRKSNWLSTEIIDDYTFKVNLKKWQNTEIVEFTENTFMISPTAYSKKGLDWVRLNPVGTGPYLFDHYTQDVDCKGVRNPNYWDAPKPYVDSFTIKYVPEWSARKAAAQTGEGDIIQCELGKESYDMKSLGFGIKSLFEANAAAIPSAANPGSPWSKLEVREAAEYAIDREAMISLGFGEWYAPYQLVPKTSPLYNPDFVGRRYDPDKAKALLKQAGYENGFETSLFPPPFFPREASVAMQDYWSKVGIQTKIEYFEAGKYFMFGEGEPWEGVVLTGMGAEPNYNRVMISHFTKDVNRFMVKLDDPELVNAVYTSIQAPEADIALMKECLRIAYEDAIMFPVWSTSICWAEKPYVMDSGAATRGFAIYFQPNNVWLDK